MAGATRTGEEHLQLVGVRAVMVFCDDPEASCSWWARVVDVRPRRSGAFAWVDLPGGVELGFHPADLRKNPPGASTVPYWSVPDLDAALRVVVAAGAHRLRGPLEVEPGRRIAQVRDPHGAVMGLDEGGAASR